MVVEWCTMVLLEGLNYFVLCKLSRERSSRRKWLLAAEEDD